MDTMYDSIVEKEFSAYIAPALEAIGVTAERMHHEQSSNVLHVDLVFEAPATTALRHEVLGLLSKFEWESSYGVITSPRFILAGSEDE